MLVHDLVIKVSTCRSKYTHDAIGSIGSICYIKMCLCRAAATDFASPFGETVALLLAASAVLVSCVRQPAVIEMWDTEAGMEIVAS
jgi:hypothetical protein